MPRLTPAAGARLLGALIAVLLLGGLFVEQLVPPTAKLKRLLAEGRINEAFDLLDSLRPAHRPAAARALMDWVSTASVGDELRADACLPAIRLDLGLVEAYRVLGELAAQYYGPATEAHPQAVEALPLWKQVREQRPDLGGCGC